LSKQKAKNHSNIKAKEVKPGYHPKLARTEIMSLVFWEVEKDAEVPEHHHVHEQIMLVVEGTYEFALNGDTKIYYAGDVVPIASNLPHRGKALSPSKLMDVFSLPSDAYRKIISLCNNRFYAPNHLLPSFFIVYSVLWIHLCI